MSKLMVESTIFAPLEEVWAFFADSKNLSALSPSAMDVRIESADAPIAVGSQITLTFKIPLTRQSWIVRMVEWRRPHGVLFGREARFVDEQLYGPMKYWKHEHDFEAIDNKTTRMIDRITYRLPFGPVGWIVDLLIVRWKIRGMFRYRTKKLQQLFPPPGRRSR
jgi:ligand-binding SRPBCC domain-containing protein